MPETQKASLLPALIRGLRAMVAVGLPVFITWLSGNTDLRWAAFAPVIMAVAKYLRDAFKWEWLPV